MRVASDFRGAWDSIAANYNQSIGRGNFMFAFQEMNLLEFASRLCAIDSKLLNNFSNEINRIDPKYFTLFPGPCGLTTEFDLPYIVNNKGDDRQHLADFLVICSPEVFRIPVSSCN